MDINFKKVEDSDFVPTSIPNPQKNYEMVDLKFMSQNEKQEKEQLEQEFYDQLTKSNEQIQEEMLVGRQSKMVLCNGGNSNEMSAVFQVLLELKPLKKFFIEE